MLEFTINVPPENSGVRLDLFLSDMSREKELGLSRNQIQHLIKKSKVTIGGSVVTKTNHKIREADAIRLEYAEKGPGELSAEDIPLDVVYEDDDIAVINKPPGLVVHPAPGNSEHTLANALRYRFKDLSDVDPGRPGIVHRLDKDTSGLLVIAKNNTAHHDLVEQFSEHSINRKYVALVKGKMEFDEDTIELPIGRHPHRRKDMSVGFGENAKYAKTRYRTLKRWNAFSYVELEPFTGRTHQLRVHLAFLNHPVLGDPKYGKNNQFPRLALHAYFIGFTHPRTKKYIEFTSAIPKEIADFSG